MKKVLQYVEGEMDESVLYLSIVWNAVKSFILLLLILGAGWVVYSFIVPATTSGKSGFFLAYCIVTIAMFTYIFKPQGYIERIGWGLYSVLFSAIMYLSGECVVIALIILGIMLGIAGVFGEVIFTGLFTYRDLMKWVKNDMYRKEQALNVKRAIDAEKWKSGAEGSDIVDGSVATGEE